MGFNDFDKMSGDDIRLVNETARERFLEGVAFDAAKDGQYMNAESSADEESQGFAGNESGRKSRTPSLAMVGEDNQDQSTSDEQAESVEEFNKESANIDDKNEEQNDGSPAEAGQPALGRVKTRFFSSKLSTHRNIFARRFALNCFLLGSLAIAMFSLYWGALYNHSSHYHNVKFIAVVEDDGDMGAGVIPIMDSAIPQFFVYNTSSFRDKYGQDVNISEKVHHLVHTKKFWGSLIVYPGTTDAFVDSLTTDDAPAFNSTDYFEFFYKTARDLSNMRASIVPLLTSIETTYKKTFFYNDYFPSVIANITNISGPNLSAAGDMNWKQIDNRPFTDYTLLGPMQVGLIYCILLTFFQLALFGPFHAMLSPLLKPKHIILYRLVTSWATYFFLSLFFCTVSAIFHVDFTLAFGRGGFVVYWMTTWILMGAVGGANENVLSILLAYCPQYLGFWLISWIIINISASFVPLVLANRFYRYGYMTPIYNAMEIYRVIFTDTYKGDMGRNYGILAAWCVLNTLLFPFVMKIVGQKFMNDAKKRAMQK